MQVKSQLEEALDAWRFAREGVIAEVRNLPDEAVNETISARKAGARTIAEMVHHIAESGLLMAGELSRDNGDFQRKPYLTLMAEHAGAMERPQDKAALLALLEKTHHDGEARLRQAGEALLMQPIRQFNGEPARRLTWMHHGIGHEEYHRGQIALSARLLGYTPALTKLIHGEE